MQVLVDVARPSHLPSSSHERENDARPSPQVAEQALDRFQSDHWHARVTQLVSSKGFPWQPGCPISPVQSRERSLVPSPQLFVGLEHADHWDQVFHCSQKPVLQVSWSSEGPEHCLPVSTEYMHSLDRSLDPPKHDLEQAVQGLHWL